jgi:hypothetical protein
MIRVYYLSECITKIHAMQNWRWYLVIEISTCGQGEISRMAKNARSKEPVQTFQEIPTRNLARAY